MNTKPHRIERGLYYCGPSRAKPYRIRYKAHNEYFYTLGLVRAALHQVKVNIQNEAWISAKKRQGGTLFVDLLNDYRSWAESEGRAIRRGSSSYPGSRRFLATGVPTT